MTALDLLTFTLGAGLLVLVVSTTVMVMGMVTQQRQRPRRPAAPRALKPSAAQAVEQARRRAQRASAELAAVPGATGAATGQIIDVTDGHDPDRDRAVDEAIALAVQVAETDPQRIAEVIRAWIRADLDKGEAWTDPEAIEWTLRDDTAWPPA